MNEMTERDAAIARHNEQMALVRTLPEFILAELGNLNHAAAIAIREAHQRKAIQNALEALHQGDPARARRILETS